MWLAIYIAVALRLAIQSSRLFTSFYHHNLWEGASSSIKQQQQQQQQQEQQQQLVSVCALPKAF